MKRFGLQKAYLVFLLIMGVFILPGCGGGGKEAGGGHWDQPLVSIEVTPATASMPISGVKQFTATATYGDGSSRDVTTSSDWTSGTASVATISPTSGFVTGIDSGTSVITATFSGKTATAILTVTPETLLSIALTPVNPTLQIGATRQFVVLATYSDGTTLDVTTASRFSSATPAKADVSDSTTVGASNGLTTGLEAGSSVITARFEGKTATSTVTVSPAVLSFITVAPINSTVAISGTTSFVATGNYSDGTSAIISNTVLTWSSNNNLVATILATGVGNLSAGVATGINGGTATVTARSTIDLSKSGTATVIVTPARTLQSITVAPSNSTVAISGTTSFVATGNYSDGTSTIIPNSDVTWSSNDITIATILASGSGNLSTGIATGVNAGTATIKATSTIDLTKSGSATVIVTPARSLQSITVAPANSTIAISGTTSFVATGNYSDGTSAIIPNSQVTWSSSNIADATILANGSGNLSTGVATGVNAGTVTITARSTINPSKSGSATLIVTPAKTLQSITVAPANSTIAISGTTSFVATGNYSDGTSAIIPNSDVTWSSNDITISTVLATGSGNLSTGVATGVNAGTATITATSTIDLSKSGSATVIVTPARTLQSITVAPANSTIAISGTTSFVATGNYSDGTSVIIPNSELIWSSDDITIATVLATGSGDLSTGVATGVNAGTTTITATSTIDLSKSDSATLIVAPARSLQSITVAPANSTIAISGTTPFVATGHYSDGTSAIIPNSDVTWSSNDITVATVLATGSGNLSTGVATGLKAGTATIKATSTIDLTKSGSATLIVTPARTLQSITVAPANSTVDISGTTPFVATGNYSDGSSAIIPNSEVTWSSNDITVATVLATGSGNLSTGVATGLKAGTTTIKATSTIDLTKSGSATLIVAPVVYIIPGAFCPVDSGPTIPTVTKSDPTSDNQFVTTSTNGVLNEGKLITATFSMVMDPTTIESATAPLTFTVKETQTGVTVPGTVVMDNAHKIATFTTAAALLPDTRYTATITTAATSAGLTPTALACPYEWNFKTIIPPATGISPVNFGSAATFGIASTAGVVNVGATTVNGDVVLHPLAECNGVTVGSAGLIGSCNGFAPVINGTVVSPLYPDAGVTSLAVLNDLRAAYISLSPAQLPGATSIAAGTTLGALPGSPLVEGDNLFFPGVYQSLSSILITGDLTLDASGNPDAVFVFQSSSSIGTAATGADPAPHTRILLVNGAKASNVFWWVGSNQATLGTYSQFQGNILSYSSITMETGATSCGRLFAGASTDGTFVFGDNIVSVPGNANAPADCK